MALKALMLRKRIDLKKKDLEQLRTQMTDLEKREAELTLAIEEVTNEDEQKAVQESVDALIEEKEKLEASVEEIDQVIKDLEAELEAAEEDQSTEPAPAPAPEEQNKERSKPMSEVITRQAVRGTVREQLAAIITRSEVKDYIAEVRSAISQKRAITNAGLLIPDVMLDLIRHEIAKASKLLPYVRLRNVGGVARQNVAGAIPEAVWTEMCANINELTLAFNQVEVDGYKVGGYIAVCNAVLEDSDIDLANEIITAIGGAIGKALDKAILFGTGTKMPTGVVTRLAQSSQPANWGTYAPAWTDLHTSNVQTLNINSTRGAEFFEALIEKLAIAKDYYNVGGLAWVMNRKTHLHLMAKALAFDSAAALVSNTDMFPVIGGAVVEFDDDQIADNEIIGGFFGNYLLAERAGIQFGSSDIPLFLQDQTVFKGTARYDGMPVAGEAFVIVNFANTAPTTSKDFAADDANTVQEIHINTKTASVAVGSKVTLKAKTAPGKGAVEWSSATTAKATVNSVTGEVTGVSAGSSVITATCNGLTDSCTVTVT